MSNRNKKAIGIITAVRFEYCSMCAEGRKLSIRVIGECPYTKPKPSFFSLSYNIDENENDQTSKELDSTTVFLELLYTANKNRSSSLQLHSDSIIGSIVEVSYDDIGTTIPECLDPKDGMVHMDATMITILHKLMRK